MAKAKRDAPNCPAGSTFRDQACRTPSGENALSYRLKPQKAGKAGTARPAEFDYWTASAVSSMPGAKERATCVTERVEYLGKTAGVQTKKTKDVRLPFRCPPGAEVVRVGKGELGKSVCMLGGKAVDPVRDWSCGPKGKPCGTSRKTCPVQFVWREGKPHLRFCKTRMTEDGLPAPAPGPGWLVPMKTAAAASKLAKEACARWSAPKYAFDEDDEVVKLAREAFPESGGLGGRGKRRTRKRRK
jgi:hypothetical protein